MESEREIFSISGPSYLKDINWQNADHRRSIAASLVRGVSILERDRQKNRHGDGALAPDWWKSFNFELLATLIDTTDNSYYGAVYKFKSSAASSVEYSSSSNDDHCGPPRYVIAFRGTLLKLDTINRDLKLDVLVIFNELHKSTRFKSAMNDVRKLMSVVPANRIWMAGHSLGASLALGVGKEMAKNGFPFETYLFNLPFSAIPLELLKNSPLLMNSLRAVRYTATFALSILVNFFKPIPLADPKLSGRIPHIFVNPKDFVSAEHVGFFRDREAIHDIFGEKFTKFFTENTVISLMSIIAGRDPDPSFLLPSVNATINRGWRGSDILDHHRLEQWWSRDQDCETVLHCA